MILASIAACAAGLFAQSQTWPKTPPSPSAVRSELSVPLLAGSALASDCDPIDLYTGLYVRTNTDLYVPDTMPISVQRTYRNADGRSRSFGIGTSHLYDMFIVGDGVNFTYVELVLADGGRIHYDRISPGTGYRDAVFEHSSTPTEFNHSQIRWEDEGWTVALQDGGKYKLRACSPGTTTPGQCGVIEVRNSSGEYIQIDRKPNGDIRRVVSPNGKWIEFTYDLYDRVTEATASTRETVQYTYDDKGRLITVLPSTGQELRYEYDDGDRMTTIFEGEQTIQNFYDHDVCVRQIWTQGSAHGTFEFKYVRDSQNRHTETDVSEPDGTLRKVVFNENGYPVSDTRQRGRSGEASLIYRRDPRNNILESLTVACTSKHTTLQVTPPLALLQAGDSGGDYEQLLDLCTKALSSIKRH